MENLSIRMAEIADIEQVSYLFDLYRQFYQQAPNMELATTFIQNRMQKQESIILIALASNDEMVGFCQLYPSFCSVIAAPIYTLYDLFVLPSNRRTGAGKALLLAAEDLAKQTGVSRMDLTTATSNNTAQRLYESLGWEKDCVFIAYNKSVSA